MLIVDPSADLPGDEDSPDNSRYGDYIRLHTSEWRPFDAFFTFSRVEFAAAALRVASSPIMSRPYVHPTDPRVVDVTFSVDQHGNPAVIVAIAVPLPHDLRKKALQEGWSSWHQNARQWYSPEDNDRPAAYATAHLIVPIDPETLPEPAYDSGDRAPRIETCRAALAAIVSRVNTHLDDVLLAAYAGGARA